MVFTRTGPPAKEVAGTEVLKVIQPLCFLTNIAFFPHQPGE